MEGRRGPTPMPAELRELAGNAGKQRKTDTAPFKSDVLTSPPPSDLVGNALRFYEHMQAAAAPIELITELDQPALEVVSRMYARLKELWEDWETGDREVVVYSKNGHPMGNPLLAEIRHTEKQLCSELAKFAGNPAARQQIAAMRPGEDDELDELMPPQLHLVVNDSA